MTRIIGLPVVCVVLTFLGSIHATRADDLVNVFPESIQLQGARDSQKLIVQLQQPDGITRDLGEQAEWTIADPEIAVVKGGTVLPLGNGKTELITQVAGQTVRTTLSVTEANVDPPLSFPLDVLPVLTKAGCNAGRCHGAARGKDGFQLSLYGFDPAGDHYRLTEELVGRRINLSRPDASLLLTKATGQVIHTGGELFTPTSDYYATIHRWIEEGAKAEGGRPAKPIGIEVFPKEIVFQGSGEQQQMSVRAQYSDGTTRDVTSLAVFLSNNDSSAKVSETGMATAGIRGESFLMARFDTFTEGIPAITLPGDLKHEFPDVPEYNEIDALIHRKLKKLRISPSDTCSDEQFLRRVYIDLAGILPSHEAYEAFVADTASDKREKLVDELLAQPDFIDLWAMKFGELLKIRTANQVSYKALLGFHNWVRERLANETPLNEIFRDVISAQGGTFDNPPTNYFQIEANNRQLAENVAQVFLGMRIQCAQCHNHPFDRWTMDDYYGFTAFFSQIDFKQSADPREYIVYNRGQGEVYHVVDGRPVAPKFLGGDLADIKERGRREVLGEWIAADDNPYFANNMANIVWAHHFGRGIIEPVDDIRISNPPVNAELLDMLGEKLRSENYNLKSLVRMICLSRTYQLSTRPNDTNRDDMANFSKAQVRRIRAEVLLDSISSITSTKDRFARLPEDARSIEIADGAVSNYFLSTFGRAPRETVCSCEVEVEPTLSQAFHLINGETTNSKIQEGDLLGQMLTAGKTPAEIIEHLYIICYSRKPTSEELRDLTSTVQESDSPKESLSDVFWAVLNSKEFIFNH